MAHREFIDDTGVRWETWEVHPSLAGDERDELHRPLLAPHLEGGWLAFRSESERRRIVPVPDGWAAGSDDALRALLKQAVLVAPPRRLIE
jgi:hypothetical protein